MEILHLDKISRTYQDRGLEVPALKDISLKIEKGQFTALAGPSGSGKTSLLNIMGTLDRADFGRVYLEGQALSGLTPNALAEIRLKKIGFVFQAGNLIEVLSARENVEYVMLLQGLQAGTRRQKALEILRAVGLEDLAGRKPSQLSAGQAQRVAVARAVAAEPLLILADEPTAHLDSVTGQALVELMDSFNRTRRITFIVASHDPLVINRARRVIRLKDGRIEEDRTLPWLGE
jgi:putative ABC transport system ATP-binding protein